jgi:hypothetical protein
MSQHKLVSHSCIVFVEIRTPTTQILRAPRAKRRPDTAWTWLARLPEQRCSPYRPTVCFADMVAVASRLRRDPSRSMKSP